MTPRGVAPSAAPRIAPAALRALGAAVLAVALFVGWLIGSAARSGATAQGPRVQAVAVGGALFAWVVALVGVYVYSLAALPSLGPAGTSLSERIAATPILSFYGQQFGPIDALEGAFLVLAAWWSAR